MDRPTKKMKYTKEELIKYVFHRKEEEFKTIEKIKNDVKDNKVDSCYDHELYREPLAMSEAKVITIELSTGGDADGFKLEYSFNGKYWELVSGVYYWADWGVYEEAILTMEEAEEIADFYNVIV